MAKLERYLNEATGFVSIIPRRASETDLGAYSPYIGQELSLARRSRLPRLLFIDERIIVSEDDSAGLVLEGRLDVPLSIAALSDPEIHLTVSSTHGKLLHIVGADGLRPLYSCLRLATPWFGQPALQPVRGSAGGDEVVFSRPGIDMLLNS